MYRFRHAGIARTGRGSRARLEIRPRARLHPPASDLAHSACITSQPINSDDHDGFESKRRQHTQSRPSQPPDTGPLTDHSPSLPRRRRRLKQCSWPPHSVRFSCSWPPPWLLRFKRCSWPPPWLLRFKRCGSGPTLSIAPQQVCTPQAQVATSVQLLIPHQKSCHLFGW